MIMLEDHYAEATAEYVALTNSLTKVIGLIVHSVREIENTFLTIDNTVSRIYEDTEAENKSALCPFVKQEMKDLSKAMRSLERSAKESLSFVIQSASNALSVRVDSVSGTGEIYDETCYRSRLQFVSTLCKCSLTLNQLDECLFNAQVSVNYSS